MTMTLDEALATLESLEDAKVWKDFDELREAAAIVTAEVRRLGVQMDEVIERVDRIDSRLRYVEPE